MEEFEFSQQWLCIVISYGIKWHAVCSKSTDILEEHVASIIRVNKMKQALLLST
jgi:hypothetical protein